MTVSSTSSRVVFNGNASQAVWPFAFKIPDSSSIVVVYTDIAKALAGEFKLPEAGQSKARRAAE